MRTLLSLLLLAFQLPALAQPLVAATIRPLQFIAMAITDGVSEPLLVLDGTQDPHQPSLKPSQRRAMDQADVFLWGGPQLETGLEDVTGSLSGTVLSALQAPGLSIHEINGKVDPHVWLDTQNASVIAHMLARVLAELDNNNENQYLDNLARFQQRIDSLDDEISAMFPAGSYTSFAVYHNGYQYFERQFGLSHAASFTDSDEKQPGIRHILAVKKTLEEKNINCIVTGPSVNTRYLDNQLERDMLRYVTIDLLGGNINSASDAYVNFMHSVAQGFSSCTSP